MKNIKTKENLLTEEFLEKTIGKYIHATTNEHTVQDPLTKKEEIINVWFAGKVAGYEKACIQYDYRAESFLEEPKTIYRVLLCDGMTYSLSQDNLVVVELEEKEFIKMLAEFHAKEAKEIILP